MANEVKVGKNESIDSALRRLKRVRWRRCASVSTMRSRASGARRSRKRHVSASLKRKARAEVRDVSERETDG